MSTLYYHSDILYYPQSLLFHIISNVSHYSYFLPYCTSSKVLSSSSMSLNSLKLPSTASSTISTSSNNGTVTTTSSSQNTYIHPIQSLLRKKYAPQSISYSSPSTSGSSLPLSSLPYNLSSPVSPSNSHHHLHNYRHNNCTHLRAELGIGFLSFEERYVSDVYCIYPHTVKVLYYITSTHFVYLKLILYFSGHRI